MEFNFFKNFNLKSWWQAHWKESFLVFLIFILAFAVRAQLMRYQLFFEFDSYWHARMVSYVIQNGQAPAFDPLAYLQWPGGKGVPVENPAPLFWGASALIYKIFSLGAYTKLLWIEFVKFLPAFYGALTTVALYFFGKEIFGKKKSVIGGTFIGIMAATMPAFVYRTMAGFFEPTSMGYLWMAIGFVFFIRSIKSEEFNLPSIINAVIGGVALGLMAWAWKGYTLIPVVLLTMLIPSILYLASFGNKKPLVDFLKKWSITFVLFAGISFIQEHGLWALQLLPSINRWFGAAGFELSLPVLIFAIVVILAIIAGIKFLLPKINSGEDNKWVKYFAIAILYIGLIALAVFATKNLDLRDKTILGQTIGEESVGRDYFFNKYNAFVYFPAVAMLVIPFLLFRRKEHLPMLVAFFWIATTFILAWNKLKFTYLFGIPVAISVGLTLTLAIQWIQTKHNKIAKSAVLLAVAFFLITGVAAGTIFVQQNVPNIQTSPGWVDALAWMKDNTPKDSVFLNWWNEGHWITFMGERAVTIDNRNADQNGSQAVSSFLLAQDENEALTIIKDYPVNHIILGDGELTLQSAYALYKCNTYNSGDPCVSQYFATQMNCSKQVNELTGEATYNCNGNQIPGSQMAGLPKNWISTPNQFLDQRTPIFIYSSASQNDLYLFNNASNNTMATKLWFNAPLQHFKKIYDNDHVKMWEIIR